MENYPPHKDALPVYFINLEEIAKVLERNSEKMDELNRRYA